jgi:FkbM family methyltransferase
MEFMMNSLGSLIAAGARMWPFEKGRWRLGMLALRLSNTQRENVLIHTHYGEILELDLKQFLERDIYATGFWEKMETDFIRSWLKPGDTFLDIGANIGYFTTLAASCVGPKGQVIAIEATPTTVVRLQRNLALNSCAHVRVHAVAVGELEGSIQMEVREVGNIGGNAISITTNTTQSTIPMHRLDDLLPSQRFALIKMDIEGSEYKALRGAQSLITQGFLPHILFEYSPNLLVRLGDDATMLVEYLRENAYQLYLYEGHCWKIASDDMLRSASQQTIFASQTASLQDLPS